MLFAPLCSFFSLELTTRQQARQTIRLGTNKHANFQPCIPATTGKLPGNAHKNGTNNDAYSDRCNHDHKTRHNHTISQTTKQPNNQATKTPTIMMMNTTSNTSVATKKNRGIIHFSKTVLPSLTARIRRTRTLTTSGNNKKTRVTPAQAFNHRDSIEVMQRSGGQTQPAVFVPRKPHPLLEKQRQQRWAEQQQQLQQQNQHEQQHQ